MLQPLFDDWRIPYQAQQNGWLNLTCPFCGDTGMHLGSSPTSVYFHCWRCGWHPTNETLSLVLGVEANTIPQLLKQYHIYNNGRATRAKETDKVIAIHPFKLPSGTGPLGKYHKRYLVSRHFDPDRIEREWGIQGTGPVSSLDHIDYKLRIIIPIIWGGATVSFQGRDITDRSDTRYMACPKDREKVPHQKILYGNEEYWGRNRTGIVTEGVTDVWRLGPSACATFGMDVGLEQVMAIAQRLDRIFIVFDNELEAQRNARKLSTKLKMLGKEVYIQTIKAKDPGKMKQRDADALVRDLLGRT
jgi:hypothetical protein